MYTVSPSSAAFKDLIGKATPALIFLIRSPPPLGPTNHKIKKIIVCSLVVYCDYPQVPVMIALRTNQNPDVIVFIHPRYHPCTYLRKTQAMIKQLLGGTSRSRSNSSHRIRTQIHGCCGAIGRHEYVSCM